MIAKTKTLRALLATATCALLLGAAPAQADFGVVEFSGGTFNQDGSSASQAGAHPYSATTTFETTSADFFKPDGQIKDVEVDLPPGFIGNPAAIPSQCTSFQLFENGNGNLCPASSQVGVVRIACTLGPGVTYPCITPQGIYNMVPPAGAPALFGFVVASAPVFLIPKVRADGDYGISVKVPNIAQVFAVTRSTVTFWGTPADPSHDRERGTLPSYDPDGPLGPQPSLPAKPGAICAEELSSPLDEEACTNPAGYKPVPFLTAPTDCSAGALTTTFRAASWQNPGVFASASFSTDTNGNPTAVSGCENVPFTPALALAPTTDQAQTPSGLEVDVEVPDDGLLNPDGIAQSHVKKTVVTLPEGVTLNPSSAEGLGVCTPAELAREQAGSKPGEGCPNQSRIGSVDVETPILKEHLTGSLYLAQQDDPATSAKGAENPFDSLLALYIVARNEERGVIVKLPGKVELDPATGQITTTFDDLPQLPFSKFHLKFREGGRAPLVSPPACGTYSTVADFVPYSAQDPDNPTPEEIVHSTSQFQVTRGVGGGPCPSGGLPPFKPGLMAGTINNAAGSYSPFNVRLTRNDGEGEFTNFSIKLPPGITGKLAGVPFCPEAAIAAAKTRTGGAELQSPSCPKASEVGRTLVGAGVGSIQTYVPGKVYLAGPYNGSALSIVAITSAKVGPFDVGTVVIREALKVNPETAEVFIDPTGSDPIPHIIEGIPVHARDIRVYVDKPDFVLNPTNCKRTSTASTVLGSGLDFASAIDDQPITVTSPFQAADCANLGFKPKLALSLSGGTKRGDNPKFKAVLNARPGDANIGKAQVTLPHSAFLDQSHIKTICTRVQFAAGQGNGAQCPAASIYGYAKAITPLLDEPLEGPVFLRSSSNPLPDLLVALHSGKINVNLAGRIDSVGDGQIRNTFEAVPDAPVTRFTLTMQGGRKGLIVNSANLCARKNHAIAAFTGQNGKVHNFKPVLKAQCGKQAKAKNKKKR